MAGLSRRVNACLSAAVSEKRLFIQSGSSTRYIRLTPLSQLAAGAGALLAAAWLALATSTVVIDRIAAGSGDHAVAIREAFRVRIEELAGERDRREGEARSAQARFQLAMEQVSRQQEAILEVGRGAARAVGGGRADARQALGRGRAARRRDRLERPAAGADERGQRQPLSDERLGRRPDRDAERGLGRAHRGGGGPRRGDRRPRGPRAAARRARAPDDTCSASARTRWSTSSSRRWRCRSVRSRRCSTRSTIDVDGLHRRGARAPTPARAARSAPRRSPPRSFDDPELGARFDQLMLDLDRMNLMRIAAEQGPLRDAGATASYRFTSAFGARRGRRHARRHRSRRAARHPIFAAADGVVVDAGRESGYGNVVRVRHEFGFETVYAHLSKIRVRVGQQVSRGVQIGDMGSTGRSTGSHLHYEVRVNGKPRTR